MMRLVPRAIVFALLSVAVYAGTAGAQTPTPSPAPAATPIAFSAHAHANLTIVAQGGTCASRSRSART